MTPAPAYSVDTLCERFRAIVLQKELRTSKAGGTIEGSIALMARQGFQKCWKV
jgi:hypothetical protein